MNIENQYDNGQVMTRAAFLAAVKHEDEKQRLRYGQGYWHQEKSTGRLVKINNRVVKPAKVDETQIPSKATHIVWYHNAA
jgi:hypothetical protein